MTKRNHVIVVGAGVAGLAAAYYLTQAGAEVTVVDKSDGKNNCSYGNAGMIVPSHFIPLSSPGVIKKGLRWMLKAESPFYVKPRLNMELLSWGWKFRQASTRKHMKEAGPVLRDLLLRNRQLLIEFEDRESLNFGYQRNGLLMLCKTEEGLEEESNVARLANALNIPAKVLSASEVRQMEPGIEMDMIGAVYFPKDAHLHPGILMDQLKYLLSERGVRFKFNTEVSHIAENSGDKVEVMTSGRETMAATHVVLCCGAWTPVLAKNIGVSMPMQAGKGYSITIEKPEKVPQICALLAEAKVSMTPMMGQMRFGGTMEIVGRDQSVTPAKLSALKKSVTQYFPEYSLDDLQGHDTWVGLRPCSPDGLPYVGRMTGYKNCFVSTGHSMMGMSLSFSSGEIISQLINGEQAKLAHPLIDPSRYE